MKENTMKRILLSLLVVQMACCFTVYGAASADSAAADFFSQAELSIKICKTDEDYEEVEPLYIKSGIESLKKDVSEKEKAKFYKEVFNDFRKKPYHVITQVRQKNNIIGFIEYDGFTNFVEWLYVDKLYRGKKIGLYALDLLARDIKAESLSLRPNFGLGEYYESAGFVKSGGGDGWEYIFYVKKYN